VAPDPASQRIERRRLLSNVSLFSSLEDRDLDELLKLTSTRRLREGEILFRKGEPGRQLFGVLEGRLKIYSSGADGKEVVFGLSDPGDVTGEIALLDSEPRSATHPRVAIRLAEILAERLRRLSELTEDSVLLALRARLAKKLVALARSYGQPTADGTRIDLKLSQQALGDMVGTSRESINKQLRAWTQQGLVHSQRGFITLRRPRELESLARFAFD
jgi:CRP-like cAMP-binding protein